VQSEAAPTSVQAEKRNMKVTPIGRGSDALFATAKWGTACRP
jgi:hypothetical protein